MYTLYGLQYISDTLALSRRISHVAFFVSLVSYKADFQKMRGRLRAFESANIYRQVEASCSDTWVPTTFLRSSEMGCDFLASRTVVAGISA